MDGVRGIRPDVGNASILDGDVCIRHELAGLDADPRPAADDQVGGRAAHGNVYEGLGEGG